MAMDLDRRGLIGLTAASLSLALLLVKDALAQSSDPAVAGKGLFPAPGLPGGMNGLHLARRVRELRLEVKVIFTSGYDSALHPSSGLTGAFLQKPYRGADLDRALRQAFSDIMVPVAASD
jgi:DNA-binding NarL/FixJ family response regulator